MILVRHPHCPLRERNDHAVSGVVRVHVGPAIFIGMNNFSFFTDEQVLVTGPIVSHAGESAVWARQITKGSKTLTLRSPDGSPRWG